MLQRIVTPGIRVQREIRRATSESNQLLQRLWHDLIHEPKRTDDSAQPIKKLDMI